MSLADVMALPHSTVVNHLDDGFVTRPAKVLNICNKWRRYKNITLEEREILNQEMLKDEVWK